MSRTLSRSQAIRLGAVVTAGLVLAGLGLFAVGSRHWFGGDTFQVAVGFQDIGGVEEGTRVRIQGMDAGEVARVELPASAAGPVKLHLQLAGRFRRLVGDPASAVVQISSDGVWGGKYVKIIPGQPGRTSSAAPVVLQSRPTPELTEELSQAAKRLKSVLGDMEDTFHKIRAGKGTLGQLVHNDQLYKELTEASAKAKVALAEATATFSQVLGTLEDIRSGQGTLGMLVKSQDAYAETLNTIGQVREMVASVKQNADALKSMPLIRNYVVDPQKLLNRPDCRYERRWFAETRLFERGAAVLTPEGRRELARVAEWLNGHQEKGAEIVVAAYAAPDQKYDAAQMLTQKQSEVVRDYLTSEFKVHKTGWWFWMKRGVNAVGLGTMPSPFPADARRKLPLPRLDIIVFLPQG